MVNFVFSLVDGKKIGYIDRGELIRFLEIMHGGSLKGNIVTALDSIPCTEEEKVDFNEYKAVCQAFPSVLYPAFRNYYFNKRWRETIEKVYPKPVVYLDDDNDVHVRIPEDPELASFR